jgi:hypothetical protein
MQDIKKPGITARQRAWNSMRIFRNFSEGDIEATAEIQLNNLQRYLRLLEECGYISHLVKPGSKKKSYTLLHDTGPRSPKSIGGPELKGLLDPNTGEKIWVNSAGTLIHELQPKEEEPATDRQRVWTVMRKLRTFTVADIEKEVEIGNRNLLGFISLLLLCGYLEIANSPARKYARRNPQQEVYVIVNDCGPVSPKQVIPTEEEKKLYPLRLHGLRDPITGNVVWPERKPKLKEVLKWRG